jgi:hypothetical protein
MDAFAIWMMCVMIIMVIVVGTGLYGYSKKYGKKK